MSEYESQFLESPVRIPDLETKHNGLTFTYSDIYHLRVHKHWCSKDIEEYLPRITRTPTGRVSKRQFAVEKQPVLWWRAQCIFRGLESKGTIEELQTRLKARPYAPMIQELRDLEAKMKKEFGQKQRKAEDEWVAKEEAQTKAFLLEYFPIEHTGDADKKTIMLEEGRKYYNLAGVATRMKLHIRRYWKECYYNIIIGRTSQVVHDRVLGLEKEKKLEEKRKLEAEKKKKKAEEERVRAKYQSVVSKSGRGTNWDVTGSYKISCPYIEEAYPNYYSPEDIVLRVGRSESDRGSQMFAKFDFGVIGGVFRFETQAGVKKITAGSSNSAQKVGEKRKRDAYDNGEDDGEEHYSDEDDYGNPRRSPTPEAFYMGSMTKPSPKQPTWDFRWRGQQEGGEEEICLGSDEKVYKITFREPFGTKLVGTLGGDILPDCEFTGVKFSMAKPDINIGDEWAKYNERAYDRASSSRWGRW